LNHPGISILIMRAHYPELVQNHVMPIKALVAPLGIATYNGSDHLMTFDLGDDVPPSYIKFGHWVGEESENEYNGLQYDWIFMDEATQFSERAFNFLGGCLRGTNDIPKRFYVTCNPGGIGHRWVKRLFITREYKTNCKNPEENENPKDYTFIFATVDDNQIMLKKSPTYLRTLANMPEDLREAYRYGNWDIVGGNYFKEFTIGTHTIKPFKIPEHWPRYRSFDYGLDRLAVGWWAIDEDGRFWLYRAFEKKDLIVSKACAEIDEHTLPGEIISATYAPRDIWSRSKDTGRSMAETFMQNNIPLIMADNSRVQGHMLMKEAMAPIPLRDPKVKAVFEARGIEVPKELPGLMIFDSCDEVINDIRDIQADEKNPNDCSKDPHEVTHNVDMVRYFVISRVSSAEKPVKVEEDPFAELEDEPAETYETYMMGGEISASYMGY